MATPRVFSLNEVASHDSEDDCWVILNGKVLDLTGFELEHPGKTAFHRYAGKDITEAMQKIHRGGGHSDKAYAWAKEKEIGILENFDK